MAVYGPLAAPWKLDDETGLYDLVWRKAERLTSGRRDPNVQAVACTAGAGCVMVWQEDPEGLRPGQGLGPGEGWSGAIVNQKTDMWYSYIGWDEFDLVADEEGNPIPFEEFAGEEMPKAAIPMAMPVRVTDNNMCKADARFDTNGELLDKYCYYDFDTNTQYEGDDPNADFCSAAIPWTNPGGTTLNICQTQDLRILWGRNGASRTRLTLEPYTQADGTVSAWVVMAYEELKALGECDEADPDCVPIDIGKNVWYHTFDMYNPDLVAQGSMLNQPAVDRETGLFFDILTDEWGYEFYETEIARRFNLMTQPASDLYLTSTETYSGTAGILIYKQGIINQGGPADIFLRRLVLPEGFDPAVDNPYAFENMVCENELGLHRWQQSELRQRPLPGSRASMSRATLSWTAITGPAGKPVRMPSPGMVTPNDFPKVFEWAQTAGQPGRPGLGEPLRCGQRTPRLYRWGLHHDDVRLVAQLEGQLRRQ